jgi:CDP-diacylglycerol---glycerol-3-phosphate 3-phosphatidyltransferase
MNLPTWITVSRLFGLPFIIYFLSNPSTNHRWLALIIFLIASLTDWLDGYLARKLNQVTDLGKFLDPLVDKLLVFAPFLMLIELQQIPAWGVFLILSRELAIAGWRVNPSNNTIVGANIWGKLKTVTQILAIALLIAPVASLQYPWGIIAFWVAVALTLISGIIYIFPNISSSVEKSMSA